MRFFTILFLLSLNTYSQNDVKVIHIRKAKDQKCSATLLGKPGGKITKLELWKCNRIEVSGPCDYKVESFVFSAAVNGTLIEFKCDSVLSGNAKNIMMGSEQFFIEKIKVKSNVTGQIFSLPNLKFRVTQ